MRKTGSRFGEEIISLSEKQNNRYAIVHIVLLKRQVEEASADFPQYLLHGKSGELQVGVVTFRCLDVNNCFLLHLRNHPWYSDSLLSF